MRRRLAILLAAAGLVAVSALTQGCGHKLTGVPYADQPPKTTIFVQGPVDSVNHVVHIYWFGTDADGYVTGYWVKLVNPEDPATALADSQWTTHTDSIFTLRSPLGGAVPTLHVWAQDDKGVRDPNGAVQVFKFRNRPPVVTLSIFPQRASGDFSDTTFSSVTLGWTVKDADGDSTKVSYRVWLDPMPGEPIDAITTTDHQYTVPSSKFASGFVPGGPYSVKRTAHVQPVDDGGMAGSIDSVTWNVRRPVMGTRARVLIIDETVGIDASSADSWRALNDGLYTNAACSATVGWGIPRDQLSLLTLGTCQPFKSSADLLQTLKEFEAVIWFGGQKFPSSGYLNVLSTYQDALGAYLDGGGKVYLESMNLVSAPNTAGALTSSFVSTYARSSALFMRPRGAGTADSLGYWGAAIGKKLYLPTLGDSLTFSGFGPGGLNAFVTDNASQIFVQVPANTISFLTTSDTPPVTTLNWLPMPVGLRVPQTNGHGGMLILNTAPLITGGSARARLAKATVGNLGLDQP